MEDRTKDYTIEQLENELKRETARKQRRYRRRIVFRLLLALLVALVVAVALFAPILRISGDSMADTLQDGDIAIGLKLPRYAPGSVVVFRYNGGLLVKRVIAHGGDWVELDRDGRFFVNGGRLEEPYIAEPARGNCDVEFPLTVPEGSCFVVGDNRPLSIDSRSSVIGCVQEEALVGRMLLRIWPLERTGLIR